MGDSDCVDVELQAFTIKRPKTSANSMDSFIGAMLTCAGKENASLLSYSVCREEENEGQTSKNASSGDGRVGVANNACRGFARLFEYLDLSSPHLVRGSQTVRCCVFCSE